MQEKIDIIVERFPPAPDWTLSEFYINGSRCGVGVEDEPRKIKVPGETCIPLGVYELGLRHSPKFSKYYFADQNNYLSAQKDNRFTKEHDLIWVKNVPGFQYVLWHWGNTDDNTDGCYIVGTAFSSFNGQKGVRDSRPMYVKTYPTIVNLIKLNERNGKKTYVEYRNKKII